MVDVVLEGVGNDEWDEWITQQNDDHDDIQEDLPLLLLAQVLQLGIYYSLHDDAVDNRDEKIDDQIEFMEKLNAYECGPDLEMLNCKKAVLNDLQLPLVDMCSDVRKCAFEIGLDGFAVDLKTDDFIAQSCGEEPDCWGTHDGELYAAKAASYVGGITANALRRDQEDFRMKKTDLVRAAQQGMKAVFNSSTVLSKYAQAASIHSGLADLYLQGFNSAGAGLGVTLGNINSTTGTTFGVGGNAGGASTGLAGSIGGGFG